MLSINKFQFRMNQPKMYLKDGLQTVTHNHIQDLKEIMISAFVHNESDRKGITLQDYKWLECFDRVIRDHLASQERTRMLYGDHLAHSSLYVHRGIIHSFMLHYQLHDYHALQQQETQTQDMQTLRELQMEGKEFFRCVNVADYPPGKALYINFGGYNPYARTSALLRMATFIMHLQKLKQSGFRWILGSISNDETIQFYKKAGASIIKKVSMGVQERQFSILVFDLDLQGEAFSQCEVKLQQFLEVQSALEPSPNARL